MLWIETKTPEEAKNLQAEHWRIITLHEAADRIEYGVQGNSRLEEGEFWADAIKKLKDSPRQRLSLARCHFPLPAAFREAAIALRAIILQSRKQKTDYDSELADLYFLSAIWSFYRPYAEKLQQPGFNVLARIPFSEFESMSLAWNTLGCDKLELLTKTDCNWMRTSWGAPDAHTTAHEKYREVWDYYEKILIDEAEIKRTI